GRFDDGQKAYRGHRKFAARTHRRARSRPHYPVHEPGGALRTQSDGKRGGRSATDVALSNDLLRRLVRELYGDAKPESREPLKIYADNKESYFQMENVPLYITPVGKTEREFIGNLIILNNITRYKELDSAKTNFISTVSHE